jgi:hypothetical protein
MRVSMGIAAARRKKAGAGLRAWKPAPERSEDRGENRIGYRLTDSSSRIEKAVPAPAATS